MHQIESRQRSALVQGLQGDQDFRIAFLTDAQPGATYLDLESPADVSRLSDPLAFLSEHAQDLVVIDEIQRMPGLFPVLRGVIDDRRHKAGAAAASGPGHPAHGRFLLLGSATGALLAQSAESLAGRIAYLELPTLSVAEVPPDRHTALWVRGGFPTSLLSSSDAASLRWRQAFITTYLERDIPLLGPRLPAQTLRRLWTMLAHEQGQLIQANRLAAALAVSGQTVARYIDVLCDVMLVRRLQPWSSNTGKRLVRSPKLYVRDSGLVHALLGLKTLDDILAHPVAGGSWEGWVIENLIGAAPWGTQAFFYRSAGGAEIDLVLEMTDGRRWALEIQRSSAPTVSRGFHGAADDLRADRRIVVHGGREVFPMGSGIEALPLAVAMQQVARAGSAA